jgi:hypothetical protein
MGDDDPGPSAVEPHPAFYGIWPRFAEQPGGDAGTVGDGVSRTIEYAARQEN